MRVVTCWLIAAIIASALGGCGSGKTPTPPDITAEYHALLDSLAGVPPEVAVGELTRFLSDHADYDIEDSVQLALGEFRMETDGRYHVARELAREGDFDQSEHILTELARYVPDTTAGESAKQHLKFDFYYAKAQWFLIRQKHDECKAVATQLLERDLNAFQVSQVEQLLDNAGIVDVAMSQAELANARSAARQLMMMLAQQYVEEGQYPRRLSIADVKSWGAHDSAFILNGISAIEDYEGSSHSFSFTAVSSKGHHRIRVVNGQIVE